MLKPLEQFICDTCGEVMSINDGWVEWLDDGSEFRICHGTARCQRLSDLPEASHNHLRCFVGPQMDTILLMQFINRKSWLDRVPGGLELKNPLALFETHLRLTTSHYEEARQYFQKWEDENGYLHPHQINPANLRRIIEEYGEA